MQVEFSAIHPDYILPIWKKIAPLFETIWDNPNSNRLEEIFKELVIDNTSLLWMAWDKEDVDNILMVLVTRLVEGNPSKDETTVLEILGCAGQQRNLWMNYFEVIENFAKDNNCNKIKIINGRIGWKKDLAEKGMRVTGYSFAKKL